jgi:FMN reductase
MALIVTISGSPSQTSRSSLLARHVGGKLQADGFTVETLEVRDLPAEDLMFARPNTPALSAALGLVERAQGVVIATPIYKAAYSGLLKAFLDLLPQFGLAGKVVLPLATGGSLAHVLAIDYAMRPVLSSLNPLHVVAGFFVLDKQLDRTEAGLVIDPDTSKRLDVVVDDFTRALRRADIG